MLTSAGIKGISATTWLDLTNTELASFTMSLTSAFEDTRCFAAVVLVLRT